MTALLTALWPLFALIVGGHALRRLDFPGEAFWPAAERLNYFLLFPALLAAALPAGGCRKRAPHGRRICSQ